MGAGPSSDQQQRSSSSPPPNARKLMNGGSINEAPANSGGGGGAASTSKKNARFASNGGGGSARHRNGNGNSVSRNAAAVQAAEARRRAATAALVAAGDEGDLTVLTRDADPTTLRILQLVKEADAVPTADRPADKLLLLQQCYPMLEKVPTDRFDHVAMMVYQKEGEVYYKSGDLKSAKESYGRAITLAEKRVARRDKDVYMVLRRYVLSMVGLARIWYEHECDLKGFTFADARHPRIAAVDPNDDEAVSVASSFSSLASTLSSGGGSVFSLNQEVLKTMAPREPRSVTGPQFQRVHLRAPHEIRNSQFTAEDEFVLRSKMTRELVASPCELLLLRCCEVVELGLSCQSELLISPLIELAQLYEDLELYSRALLLVRRALGILCNVYDYDHPWVIELLQRADRLNALLEEQLRNEAATKIQATWRMHRAMQDLSEALGRPVKRHVWIPRKYRTTPEINFLDDFVNDMPMDGDNDKDGNASDYNDEDDEKVIELPYVPEENRDENGRAARHLPNNDDDDEDDDDKGYYPDDNINNGLVPRELDPVVVYDPAVHEGEVVTHTTVVPNVRVIGTTQDTETDTHVQPTEFGDVLTVRTTTVTKTITEDLDTDDEDEDGGDGEKEDAEPVLDPPHCPRCTEVQPAPDCHACSFVFPHQPCVACAAPLPYPPPLSAAALSPSGGAAFNPLVALLPVECRRCGASQAQQPAVPRDCPKCSATQAAGYPPCPYCSYGDPSELPPPPVASVASPPPPPPAAVVRFPRCRSDLPPPSCRECGLRMPPPECVNCHRAMPFLNPNNTGNGNQQWPQDPRQPARLPPLPVCSHCDTAQPPPPPLAPRCPNCACADPVGPQQCNHCRWPEEDEEDEEDEEEDSPSGNAPPNHHHHQPRGVTPTPSPTMTGPGGRPLPARCPSCSLAQPPPQCGACGYLVPLPRCPGCQAQQPFPPPCDANVTGDALPTPPPCAVCGLEQPLPLADVASGCRSRSNSTSSSPSRQSGICPRCREGLATRPPPCPYCGFGDPDNTLADYDEEEEDQPMPTHRGVAPPHHQQHHPVPPPPVQKKQPSPSASDKAAAPPPPRRPQPPRCPKCHITQPPLQCCDCRAALDKPRCTYCSADQPFPSPCYYRTGSSSSGHRMPLPPPCHACGRAQPAWDSPSRRDCARCSTCGATCNTARPPQCPCCGYGDCPEGSDNNTVTRWNGGNATPNGSSTRSVPIFPRPTTSTGAAAQPVYPPYRPSSSSNNKGAPGRRSPMEDLLAAKNCNDSDAVAALLLPPSSAPQQRRPVSANPQRSNNGVYSSQPGGAGRPASQPQAGGGNGTPLGVVRHYTVEKTRITRTFNGQQTTTTTTADDRDSILSVSTPSERSFLPGISNTNSSGQGAVHKQVRRSADGRTKTLTLTASARGGSGGAPPRQPPAPLGRW